MTAPGPITLQALAGPITGSFLVAGDAPVAVGRAATADICLINEGVSRKHATLVWRDGAWQIVDHNSTGGTFINGVQLEGGRATPLRPGDLLKLGPSTFRVRDEGDKTGPMATLIDAPEPGQRVERGSSVMVPRADRRLRLLSDGLSRLSRAGTESELARVALEMAAAGSGYRWGAILRPVRAGESAGEFEIVAAIPEGSQARGSLFSRSLVRQAAAGELVVLTEDRLPGCGQSIAEMRIHSAMCAPIYLGEAVEGFLYLDSRGEAGSVNSEAAGFCDAVAKAYGLAIANLKRADLQRRHSRLQVDLDAAREAQQLSMPSAEADLGFIRYAMRTVPGQFVAGDLFNIIRLSSGAVAVCLGDVAGHGVASALVMSALQAHLHAQIEASGDPHRAVESVNRYLAERAAAGRFASLWVGVFEPAGRLSFVDAGHGHWMVQRAGEPAARSPCRAGIPVGVLTDVQYEVNLLDLRQGDRLILYSDGIIEQRGPEGEQFGKARLAESLARTCASNGSLAQMVEELFLGVVQHAGAPGFDDDTSAAVIEFRG